MTSQTRLTTTPFPAPVAALSIALPSFRLLIAMSAKGLILLLVVGCCATQVASGLELSHHDRLRHERGVQELLAAAKEKLAHVMVAAEDAARASLETVMQYVRQLEAEVLSRGTETLHKYGYEVNLTVVAEVFKSDLQTCVSDLNLKEPLMAVVTELTSCISKDSESLKQLMQNMQDLWATARTLPATMQEVSSQCAEHAAHDDDVAEEALEDLLDHSDHDLADKSNALLHEASKTMSKRALWGFGRVTKCIRSVYSLAKSDMMLIPGQIVASAANAFKVTRAASGGMQSCVSLKMTENMPTVISVLSDLGTCMAKMNLDEIVQQYPLLKGVKKLVEVAKQIEEWQKDPFHALPGYIGSSEEETGSTGGSGSSGSSGYLSYIPGGETASKALAGASKLAGYLWG